MHHFSLNIISQNIRKGTPTKMMRKWITTRAKNNFATAKKVAKNIVIFISMLVSF